MIRGYFVVLPFLAWLLACRGNPATPAAPMGLAESSKARAASLNIKVPQSSDCSAMNICELAVNSTAVIKADVLSIGAGALYAYDQDFSTPDGGVETRPTAMDATPISLGNVQVLRGSVGAVPSQLLIDGFVDGNGRSKNGPLKSASKGQLSLYFFVNDYHGRLPLYALGCGGQFWVESAAGDGGTTVSSSFYNATNGALGQTLNESAFVAEVDRYWGAKRCPAIASGSFVP